MKGAVLETIGGPLQLRTLEPLPLQYGQVRVKMTHAGICGAQLLEIAGLKGNAKHIPHLMGHEGRGIVQATGTGVTQVKAGDPVILHWRVGAGIESALPQYKLFRPKRPAALITSGRVVTFATEATVSENRMTRVSALTPPELCTLLGCSLSTALGIVERDANIVFGESVLVLGVGGLGINLIRAASMRRAGTIYAIDRSDEKAQLAAAMGATQFLCSGKGDWRNAGIMEGRTFDAILDTVGAGMLMQQALPYLAPSGRYVMVGQPRPDDPITITGAAHLFAGEGKSIRATQGGGFVPQRDIPRYVRLYDTGQLDLEGIITDTIPFSGINRAIERVRRGDAGRIMITFDE